MANNDLERILQQQRLSEQNMQNFSFDTEFQCLFMEIAGYDSVSDTLKRISVDGQGRILISPSSTVESVWEYGFQNTIADNALTTLLTYTVTIADLYLDKIMGSGTADAEYQVLLNSVVKSKYMTSEQDRVAKFEFPMAQRVTVGDIIQVKVIHFRTGVIADFNCSLIGHK